MIAPFEAVERFDKSDTKARLAKKPMKVSKAGNQQAKRGFQTPEADTLCIKSRSRDSGVGYPLVQS